MTDTANENCRVLLDVLSAHGVDTLVLSPGSRNTPLMIGASARPSIRKLIISDERTAAFAALGIGIVTRRPVALVCTSGTALYNYAPAVAEAYYQRIPLIVITADRPAQWIDQDDSQTLRQFGALDKIVKRSYDIYAETGMSTPCGNREYSTEREWFVNRTANEAVLTATQGHPGPVHINMQFANPLNRTCDTTDRKERKVEYIANDWGMPPHLVSEIANRLADKRIMVVAGFMGADDRLNKAVKDFSTLGNVTVLAETISNLHIGHNAQMIDSVLTRLTPEELRRMQPDIVISIGGAIISRKLKEYLRGSEGTEHWTLRDTDVSVDCFQRLAMHIEITPRNFFKSMTGMLRHSIKKGMQPAHGDYRHMWECARDRISKENRRKLASAPWSELSALDRIFQQLPSAWNLFLSNGTAVRYAQILIERMPHACYSNRGVSGIDGTNATALGASLAYGGTTLLVTGDMSFAYCPEIMNLRPLGGDLRIVVINNRGGGIFRFIPTTRQLDIREEYFCSDPKLPIEALTRAYGWEYLHADSAETLNKAIGHLLTTPNSLLEITVDPETSSRVLIEYLNM